MDWEFGLSRCKLLHLGFFFLGGGGFFFFFFFYGCTFGIWKFPGQKSNRSYSSQQWRILNPLSQARDQIRILMDTSQIRFHCTTMGQSEFQQTITFRMDRQ